MKTIRLLALLAVVALGALAAQQPMKREGMMGQGMMPHRMMQMQQMMGPMMHALAFAPDHLLMRKDAVGLSAQQVAQLTALRDAARAAHDAAAAEAKTHMEALTQAASAATPDTAALKPHFLAAHAAMGKAHWAVLAAAARAKAVLTDGQRARVQAWADSMQASMKQHQTMMPPSQKP